MFGMLSEICPVCFNLPICFNQRRQLCHNKDDQKIFLFLVWHMIPMYLPSTWIKHSSYMWLLAHERVIHSLSWLYTCKHFPSPRTPFLHSLHHQNTSNSSFRDHIKWLHFGEIFQAGSALLVHVEVSFNLHPANTSCLSVPWYGSHCWICHLPSSYFFITEIIFHLCIPSGCIAPGII